jgi:hypothetical protein
MIKFRHMPQLMIGFNPNKVADKEGYAKWNGLNLILIGLVLTATGLGRMFLASATATLVSTIAMFALFVLLVITFYGSRRYEKRGDSAEQNQSNDS